MDRGAEDGEATAPSRDHVQIVPLVPVAARQAGPVIDISPGFDRPRLAPVRQRALRLPRTSLWAAVIVVSFVTALIAFRGPIVEALPPLASAYSAFGLPAAQVSLELGEIQIIRIYSRGLAKLRIEGGIINRTGQLTDLPPIELSLRSADGAAILSWQSIIPQSQLGPGGSSRFVTEINAPSAGANHLSVRIGDGPEQIIAID